MKSCHLTERQNPDARTAAPARCGQGNTCPRRLRLGFPADARAAFAHYCRRRLPAVGCCPLRAKRFGATATKLEEHSRGESSPLRTRVGWQAAKRPNAKSNRSFHASCQRLRTTNATFAGRSPSRLMKFEPAGDLDAGLGRLSGNEAPREARGLAQAVSRRQGLEPSARREQVEKRSRNSFQHQ
jgi:hypothetical protein